MSSNRPLLVDRHQSHECEPRIHQNVTLAAFYSFVAVEAPDSSALRCLYRLTIHDDNGWTRSAASLGSNVFVDCFLKACPHACVLPVAEVMINRAPHGKLPRQKSLLAVCSQQVEDRIQYSANIGCTRSATGQRSRKKRGDDFPGRIR